MIKKPLVRIVLVLSVLALAGIVALAAAGRHGVVTTADGRMSIATQAPSHITPWNEPTPGLTTIASNLSRYPYGVYFCCFGYTISGAESFLGQTYWDAVPFTPTTNISVTEIQVSVGWGGSSNSGTNGVTISLAADSNGLPGKTLASANLTGLSDFGSCCVVTTVKDPAGYPVTAGTQYWVVVGTSTATQNTYDGWAMNSTDMRSAHFATYSGSSGWGPTEGVMPGYAVLGQ